MNEILQILSVSIFDKTLVNQLFMKRNIQETNNNNHNQLNMFDLQPDTSESNNNSPFLKS